MSDDSKTLSRVEDILSGEDYLPKKPMSRVEELLMDGAMVPKVDDTDNGKVLKVIDGEWQPGEDVSGDNLPPVSSLDNGKVLKVVSGEWNMGDDKSESSFVYISSSYPFSGSKVALPANINSVLIANYTSSPKVPTFLVSSNNIIFEPKNVDISVGTTPSVHIRWGRMYSTFDSATRKQDIYNDSISYNTQNQTTEASYFKSKAIQTIPPVDVPDNGKVMQVAGGHWVAEILPEVYGVPVVEQADVGKVLKATEVGEYDWGNAPDPLPAVTAVDNGKVLKVVEGAWDKGDIPSTCTPVEIEAADYHALTTPQKEDPTKVYFVKAGTVYDNLVSLIERNPSGTISTNVENDYNTPPSNAFNGVISTMPISKYTWWSSGKNYWSAAYGNQLNPTIITYRFPDSAKNMTIMKVIGITGSENSSTVISCDVQGSNDGENWTSIAIEETPSITFSNSEILYSTILLDDSVAYEYVRLVLPIAMSTYNSIELGIDEIYVYSADTIHYDDSTYYKNIKHGKTENELPAVTSSDNNKILRVDGGKWSKDVVYREITQAEYDLLPSSKNSDGIIYFITDNS